MENKKKFIPWREFIKNNDPNNLRKKVRRFIQIEGKDALKTDAAMTEFVLDNCEIKFVDSSTFFCMTDLMRENLPQYFEVLQPRFNKEFEDFADEHYNDLINTKTFGMRFDFGHTCPNWSDVISLGFVGLKKRVVDAAKSAGDDADKKRFFDAALRQYNAAERFIARVAKEAEKAGKTEIAQGLSNLLVSAPKNLFEGFQMLLLYHALQHFGEQTWIRTFGRIDVLLHPLYDASDKDEARRLINAFIEEINGHGMSENQPFALGGSDKDGNDLINDLSYMIIDEYKKIKPPYVKIHIICTEKTPEDFLKSALDGIRNGANSICFFGDDVLKRSLLRLGIDKEDTVDYHIDGCYECGGYGELTSPATGKISIAKAIELTLNGGKDVFTGCQLGFPVAKTPETFEEFYAEFLRQLRYIAESAKKYIGGMEEKYPRLHAGPFFTSTFAESVEKGVDIFAGFGAKYNNTSINAVGLATAVDSLVAVKKLVYDDKTLSFDELSELMRNNWAGRENLRMIVRNKFPKYGMGDAAVDAYAVKLVEELAGMINGAPNAKGGVYRLGLHSITNRWIMGKALGATPDGRLAGESTSLNTGASFGADREGVLGHILSVTSLDATYGPNSVILDLDLHSSAVKGENGLEAMYATLRTYLDRGGFSVHYNVLDAETLRAAQKNPEDYPNLQVRICGWNFLFGSLGREAQDEYIMRSERE